MHRLGVLWAARNEEVLRRRHKRRTVRECMEKISEMPELAFEEKFRLNKTTFHSLCQDLRAHTQLRGTAEVPLEVKVLCTLSFLATGSYQKIVGMTHYLPQRTASRCIKQVVKALNSDFMLQNIHFPQTLLERLKIKQEFQRRFQLPGVIGCIDCTQVAISKPGEDEHLYFNRKGYHSLNVQMICDHNLLIMNVNAKYGGATHDSFIWASSQVEVFMRELHQHGEQTWLLGDSGYPQRAWLMTPILNAVQGSRENVYTSRHIKARNCIERCFGLLKTRWRCLLKHRTLHYNPHVASKIISACCVLHNIAIKAQLPPPHDIVEEHDEGVEEIPGGSSASSSQQDLMHGRAVLNALVNRL